MAPPELPRDAPVVDVPHPLEVGLAILVRTDLDVALLDGRDGLVGERLDLHKPLRRQARFDDVLRAVALADLVDVFLDRDQRALGFQIGDDFGAGFVAIESSVDAALCIDMRRLIHHVDGWQAVALPQSKIVRVVGGRYFDRTCPEFAVHIVVGDDGDFAPDQRQPQPLAVKMQIAFVVGMHRDGGVAQHRLRPSRRDGDETAWLLQNLVAYLPEAAFLLFVNDLKIGDGGLATRTPINDISAAIDQPLLVQANEGLSHRDRELLAHGEIFARPIDARAEALHLLEDRAAVELLPLPDAFEEGFATHLVPVIALFGELALDHQLRGDAGVVGSRNP